MTRLQSRAQGLLDHYLRRLRVTLAGSAAADHADIERDVRDHIACELAEEAEPVGEGVLQRTLDRLGNPAQWAGGDRSSDAASLTIDLPRASEDWKLAYLSLGLLVLAVALPPFLWIGLFAAFLAARASLAAASARDDEERALRWLLSPALLTVYVPMVAALLLWPAAAVRFSADTVLELKGLSTSLPPMATEIAQRVAAIRLATFDPVDTTWATLRSGHWLIAPVGLWLCMLAGIARLWPRPVALAFRPLVRADSTRLARSLFLIGAVLCAFALMQAGVKQV